MQGLGEWFQSHNGAIAAGSSLMNMRKTTLVSIPQWCDCCPLMPTSGIKAVARFNPTMVRLLLSQLMAEYSTLARFNPTMVRLLPEVPKHLQPLQAVFQSHNGAIAAYWDAEMRW